MYRKNAAKNQLYAHTAAAALRYTARITVLSVGLLSPFSAKSATLVAADSVKADTSARIVARDSLARLQEGRKSLYNHREEKNDVFTIPASRLFNADITAPSELLENAPLCLPVRFGLSNQMNRFLVYGNVAPLSPLYSAGPLLFSSFDPLKGTDDVFATEFSEITLYPNNVCRYSAYPSETATPEGSFFWENGVFGENLFNVRFMRPLSERLTVNAFSGYRHFNNTRYSHDGNGVYSFYQSFADTAVLSNRGYNPLTNEYAAGVTTRWAGSRGNDLRLGIKYADCEHDIALDREATDGWLSWARLHQYRTAFDAAGSGNRIGAFVLDFQGRFETDAIVRHAPDSGLASVRKDAANTSLALGIQAAAGVWRSDTVSVSYRIERIERTPFSLSEQHSVEQTPGVCVTHPFRIGPLQGSCTGGAGYTVFGFDDSLGYAPTWSASMALSWGERHARLYAKQGALPYFIPYDGAQLTVSPFLDRYRIGGGEMSFERGGASCIIGCQSIEGISRTSVTRAWPEAVPPYEQPHFVLYAQPGYGPWNGFTLASRIFIADRAPAVKAQGTLAYTAHPTGTTLHADARISLDYWSKRDPIGFAGISNWNREIFDLNCQLAAHIGTFRFFAKISNLLNRKFAYVPGYYSPGVTFRWGINWYLQK